MENSCPYFGKCSSFMLLLARICLAAIFIGSGIGKLMAYDATADYMTKAGMTNVPILLYAAAIIEILGGLGLLLGWKTRGWALLLFLFLIPVTVIFHHFWNLPPNLSELQMVEFLKNLAIGGGLLSLLAAGPGQFSVDGCQRKA